MIGKLVPNGNQVVLLYDPYPISGGGGQVQSQLIRILNLSLTSGSIRVLSTSDRNHGLSLYWHRFRQALKYRRQIESVDLLVLQSHFDPGSVVLGRHALAHKVPYIVVPRGDYVPTLDLFGVTQSPFRKWLMWILFGRQLLRNAAAVVVTSELERNRLQKVGASTNRFYIIPDPAPQPTAHGDSAIDEYNEHQGQIPTRPYALWLGRVAREKGLDLLLECWPQVNNRCPGAQLVMAGSISHQEVYQSLIRTRRQLKLEDSIIMQNWVSGIEKARLLAQARCLVLPSHFESLGLVVIEALAARTPVVVSTGTPWQHIDGIGGRWLPREPQLWSEVIADYLSSPFKKEVPYNESQKLLLPYDVNVVADQWSHLITDVLSTQSRNS
jgi:glycosyltransferase involved in cell wall biosynthesis